MTDHKKAAARKAAAKYSTNPIGATYEYAALTEQLGLYSERVDGLKKLQEEMLSKLPLYRHPCNGEIQEYMIFFSPNCLNIDGLGYQLPRFIEALKKKGVAEDLLKSIKEYVRESELRIIELAECKDELDELKEKFTKAASLYKKKHPGDRPDKRNVKVVQALGISTGHRQKSIDYKQLYFDYVILVRKKGLKRCVALERIKQKYEINSVDSTQKALFKYRKSLLDKWAQEHPSMLSTIKQHLRGLIPSR